VALLAVTHAGYAQLSVTMVSDLGFGALVPNSGGTVVITPLGERRATGGVQPLACSSSLPSAAVFTVTGDTGATYSIMLPADGTVSLSDGHNHTMSVDTFTPLPSPPGQLSSGGTQTVKVGATLHVSQGQAVGAYGGSFDVTVAYN